MDSDVPHNQAGGTDTETGAKVLPFRGEWFGSPEELVPIGPRARVQKDAADGRAHPGGDGPRGEPVAGQIDAAAEEPIPASAPHVGADDFWAGLADAGDLIQFPAAPAAEAADVGPGGSLADLGRGASFTHPRRPAWLGVAVAALGFVVIGLRLSNGAESGALQPGAAVAQTALSIAKLPVNNTGVDQQQMREVPLRVRMATQARAKPRVTSHPPSRASRRILVSQSRPSSAHTQAAVYSPAPGAQTPSPAAPGSGAPETSSGSGGGGGGGAGGGGGGGGGGGSGGGNSHGGGGGSHPSGPSGRGAAFGPGKMGG